MLSQTVAIVTGGSSGLGAAAVKTLIRHGARVCVADLETRKELFLSWANDDQIIKQNQHNHTELNSLLTYAITDVTDSNQIKNALDHIEQVYGEPVNTVINCAGIAIAQKTLSKKGPHSLDDFTKTIMINMVGTFNVNRLAAERMSLRENDVDGLKGCIINTASIAAYEGQIGQVAYAASKGGIVAMTLPMARELASYRIRVMTIVSQNLCL